MIIISVFQAVVNVMEFNMSAFDAVSSPRFHHHWLYDINYIKENFDPTVKMDIEFLGYNFENHASFGRMEILLIQNNIIEAVGDN